MFSPRFVILLPVLFSFLVLALLPALLVLGQLWTVPAIARRKGKNAGLWFLFTLVWVFSSWSVGGVVMSDARGGNVPGDEIAFIAPGWLVVFAVSMLPWFVVSVSAGPLTPRQPDRPS